MTSIECVLPKPYGVSGAGRVRLPDLKVPVHVPVALEETCRDLAGRRVRLEVLVGVICSVQEVGRGTWIRGELIWGVARGRGCIRTAARYDVWVAIADGTLTRDLAPFYEIEAEFLVSVRLDPGGYVVHELLDVRKVPRSW